MDNYIGRHDALDAVSDLYWVDERLLNFRKEIDAVFDKIKDLPFADVQILSSLLAELTHKERTDRYHVWTTTEVKQWIADKITEVENDG